MALLALAPAAAEDAEDEVVEGHTTYASFEVDGTRTISVIGDVQCHFEVLRVEVGVPPSVGNADADCSADIQVFGSMRDGPDPMAHDLSPTDRTFEVEGPNGGTWTTTEYVYEVGGEEHRAWSVDAGEPQAHPETGDEYQFVMALPTDVPDGEALELQPVEAR